MRALGYIVTTAFMLALGSILNGWGLTILWGWFIVPTFHLSSLAIAPAIGLGLVINYITVRYTDTESPDRSFGEHLFRSFLWLILTVGLYLGMGWIVHLFM